MAETQTTTKRKSAAGKPVVEGPVATTIVAKFEDAADAEKALRTLNKTLRDEEKTIYQGAIVSREEDGEVHIKDMRDLGLADIIIDAADATIGIGLSGMGLLVGMATAGLDLMFDTIRVVRNSAGQVIGVTAEALAYPNRKLLKSYQPGSEILKAGDGLQPGDTAIVVTADEATASELATDLARKGGVLL